MTRQEANRKLLELISAEIEANPDLRFNQILVNKNITKTESGSYYQQTHNTINYFEEPTATLHRIYEKQKLRELEALLIEIIEDGTPVHINVETLVKILEGQQEVPPEFEETFKKKFKDILA